MKLPVPTENRTRHPQHSLAEHLCGHMGSTSLRNMVARYYFSNISHDIVRMPRRSRDALIWIHVERAE